MFCKKCGANIPNNTSFCPACGQDLRAAQPVETQPGQFQQPQQIPQQQYQVYQQAPKAPKPPKPETPAKGFGISGMILGICALCFSMWIFLSIPLAIASAIPSSVGLSKAAQVKGKNVMALVGLICSIIAFISTIVLTFIAIFFYNEWYGFWNGIGLL